MSHLHDYHERSKHHLDRYAPGPGGLDWATQPDPFRRFAGAPAEELPLLAGELAPTWDDLFRPGGVPAQPFGRESVAALFQLSLGLAAWKSHGGSRWALRCNPSSGNLHPTEGYLACPDLPGLAAGVYHYQPHDHCLERRVAAPLSWSDGILVALTGIHWREAWKYGVRAFRYCQHDCGHALAALAYAATALGWPVRLLTDWGDDEIAALTGADRTEDFPHGEREEPEAVVWVGPGDPPTAAEVLVTLSGANWAGRANRLSPRRRDWPEILEVAAATRRPHGGEAERTDSALPPLPALAPSCSEHASRLIRRRRSAQAFDSVTRLSAGAFFRALDALLPRPGVPPWSLRPGPAQVHLVLFVHRVDGLRPGVYCLARDPAEGSALRAAMRPDWRWEPIPACPAHLPLALLAAGDVRDFAATVSCHQEIAADSAFAVAMLARFDAVTTDRPWRYRDRFWEAGMVGQALYLQAEAAGVQGTGIGCYFDDAVHEALQLDQTRYQDLYHFTVGGALTDTRLRTAPPYAHLADRATWGPPAPFT